jgi:hypothetical protein
MRSTPRRPQPDGSSRVEASDRHRRSVIATGPTPPADLAVKPRGWTCAPRAKPNSCQINTALGLFGQAATPGDLSVDEIRARRGRAERPAAQRGRAEQAASRSEALDGIRRPLPGMGACRQDERCLSTSSPALVRSAVWTRLGGHSRPVPAAWHGPRQDGLTLYAPPARAAGCLCRCVA